MADTGLPGSPNASARPPGPSAVPNQVGRPGRSATPQKRASTPSAENASRTWSCSPTDTPPDTHTTSASQRARASAVRVAPRSSRTPLHRHHLGARAGGQRGQRRGVGAPDPAWAEPLAGLLQLVAGGQDRQARPAGAAHLGAARACCHAERRRPQRRSRAQHQSARPHVLARPADVGPVGHRGHRYPAVGALGALDRHHRGGAGGHERRRWRSAWPCPARAGRGAGPARRATRPPPAGRPRPRPAREAVHRRAVEGRHVHGAARRPRPAPVPARDAAAPTRREGGAPRPARSRRASSMPTRFAHAPIFSPNRRLPAVFTPNMASARSGGRSVPEPERRTNTPLRGPLARLDRAREELAKAWLVRVIEPRVAGRDPHAAHRPHRRRSCPT